MTDAPPKPLRVLFCIGVTQNFFDLPSSETGKVWQAYSAMFSAIAKQEGLSVLGTMDDDRVMVGTSAAWPWTCYILADVADFDGVVKVCDLFRSTPVEGDEKLWKYGRIEARIGRELVMQT
jgi:hypothetical protein